MRLLFNRYPFMRTLIGTAMGVPIGGYLNHIDEQRKQSEINKKPDYEHISLARPSPYFFNHKRGQMVISKIEDDELLEIERLAKQCSSRLNQDLSEFFYKKFGLSAGSIFDYYPHPILSKIIEKNSELQTLLEQQSDITVFAQGCVVQTLAVHYEGFDSNYLSDAEVARHPLGPKRYDDNPSLIAKHHDICMRIMSIVRAEISKIGILEFNKLIYEYDGARTCVDHTNHRELCVLPSGKF